MKLRKQHPIKRAKGDNEGHEPPEQSGGLRTGFTLLVGPDHDQTQV